MRERGAEQFLRREAERRGASIHFKKDRSDLAVFTDVDGNQVEVWAERCDDEDRRFRWRARDLIRFKYQAPAA